LTSRKQWFLDLRELIDSAESNFDHGRPKIGRRQLMRAYFLMRDNNFTQWASTPEAVTA